jgi:hypothetical protein
LALELTPSTKPAGTREILGVDAGVFGCYDFRSMKTFAGYTFYFGYFSKPPESQLLRRRSVDSSMV